MLNAEDGVYINQCLDNSLFYLQALQAHIKTQEQLIQDPPPIVGDAVLVAYTERAMFVDLSWVFNIINFCLHPTCTHLFFFPACNIKDSNRKFYTTY